ncbi:MarR family winged helix-turn-helix transcriptional regulator [Nocardioides marmorisolisilvae]|uniref:MarR family transcriptional regulator n=1 Tax=Nocardioides marmorisolisilvae TaxID=1542737 RepID=A0A3N0DNS2_9ACTN|nr:MarR family transcriptional regulator [Nocardioides marmorisolisilvae]RNL77305.1 MarR family transcriptional regulator [Nocardioides marmorisolisilvae]
MMITMEAERDEAIRDLEHEIGKLLRRVRRGLTDRAALVDPSLNATAYPLLITLNEFGPHRAADLADLFALDKGAVSRVVHQLLELDLIERTPDPNDGRASILQMSAKGRQRLAELADQRREEFGAKLAGWDADNIHELARGLARFNLAISD